MMIDTQLTAFFHAVKATNTEANKLFDDLSVTAGPKDTETLKQCTNYACVL